MTDLGHLSNLAGAHSALARSAPAATPASATVQNAVSPPLVAPQNAVTQPPTAGNAEWQRRSNSDGQQPRPAAAMRDREPLAATLDHLNRRLGEYQTNLRFDMDDQYQQIVVRIVDRETQEVVRQIPAESAMALAKAFAELEATNLRAPASASPADSQGNSPLQVEGWLLRATA
jgi:flagellar protein FlaG